MVGWFMIDLSANPTPSETFYGIRAMQMLLETKEDQGKSWEIDTLSYPVLLQLNRIPGVATTWCCEGHPEFIAGEWCSAKMYYAMVATASGREFLRTFCEDLFVHLTKVFEHEHGLKDLENPAWLVKYTEGHLCCWETNQWYSSTAIEARCSNPDYLKVINTEIAVLMEQKLVGVPELNYARMQDDLNIVHGTFHGA